MKTTNARQLEECVCDKKNISRTSVCSEASTYNRSAFVFLIKIADLFLQTAHLKIDKKKTISPSKRPIRIPPFFKNPSISYKKDLRLSSVLQNLHGNFIIFNASPLQQQPVAGDGETACRKRQRDPKPKPPPPRRQNHEIEENGGPMSHQDYIDRTRQELIRILNFCTSQDYEELTCDVLGKPGTSNSCLGLVQYESHLNESDRVKSIIEQRFPHPGEPVYVSSGPICTLLMHDFGEDTWDYKQHRWSKKSSIFSTYECWKCGRPGHLAEDCFGNDNKANSIPPDLALYKRCHQMGKDISATKCNECYRSLSLATCLHCIITLCDNHLNEHIQIHSSHRQYSSHKLSRLVKCCKSTCKVTDVKDLLTCQYCFNKAFDKFYGMYTATCTYIISKNSQKGKYIQLSDFIF
ncbi:hypothetical protein D8674_024618 [Pyrus ussuriensis x Pyrus communis]|uniref:CCHC-type domain-containing protein n=1 Tax=Pyrus ussuriensis x Pyrus communis TaxID=2448454 RepID=A0A5N5H3E8_9ROSA|nr:hypothetical protein D8674_024618 [Pyrus ussuriensis x Pyrus communis]